MCMWIVEFDVYLSRLETDHTLHFGDMCFACYSATPTENKKLQSKGISTYG